jgi:hypothetical protein
MKSFLNYIKQKIQGKHAVIGMARMNPPTIGHEKAVSKLKAIARDKGADHLLLISHTHDKKKNPLTPEQKMIHLKRAFPNVNMKLTSKDKTLGGHLDDLHKKGYSHVSIIAGEDRLGDYKSFFDRYNKDKKFKTMNVISAGNRNEKGSDVEKISGTKMRSFVDKGDYDSFRKHLPSKIANNPDHVRELYRDVKRNAKI